MRKLLCQIALLSLLLGCCRGQNPQVGREKKQPPPGGGGSFSINSPRSDDEDELQGDENQDVLVRLPPDLRQVLDLQQQDRSRIHAAILGLPEQPEQDFLSESSPTTTTTTRTTTTTTTTTRRRDDLYPPPEEVPNLTVSSSMRESASGGVPTKNNGDDNKRGKSADAPGRKSVEPQSEETARSFWSIAWEAHVYFSGTLFVLLAAYCTVNILRLHTFSRLFSRGYFVGLNLCLILLGLLRPIYLFADPYNLGNTWPRWAAYLLLDLGYPCITTAFAILFLALLRATQIELVSPGFQNPRALGIFCGLHFAICIAVDVVIGLFVQVRYIILICQGFFIVWSLLLSAGYFYIFSAMKKVALRSHPDMFRGSAPYPKLDQYGGAGDHYSLRNRTNLGPDGAIPPAANSNSPPLARAVRLTLGVAVLGSLMGGVQLFGMIKMLGLQKVDLNQRYNNDIAWYGYQVSMRILELATCALLAVIATTPLRSDPTSQMTGRRGWRSKLCCCLSSSNPPVEFQDELYSEICSNNHTVRRGQNQHQMLEQQFQPQGNNPYGSLAGDLVVINGQGQVMPLGPMGDSAVMVNDGEGGQQFVLIRPTATATTALDQQQQQQQPLMMTSRSSSSNPNSTMRSTQQRMKAQQQQGGNNDNRVSAASSRATLDTAVYSNMRSRPNSMLLNDAGFIRFRPNDPDAQQQQPQHPNFSISSTPGETTSSSDSVSESAESHDDERRQQRRERRRRRKRSRQRRSNNSSKNKMQNSASQSFDETAMIGGHSPAIDAAAAGNDELGNLDRTQSPIYKSIEGSQDGVRSEDNCDLPPEAIYEPPPGMRLPPPPPTASSQIKGGKGGNGGIYSESDLDSVLYGAAASKGGIYSSRAESRCSSISATQSFDMRMYGRTNPNGPPIKGISTMKPTVGGGEGEKKLENPYYYYGSTRNQKKYKQQQQQQQLKPRPLLPSQRQQLLAAATSLGGSGAVAGQKKSDPRQVLLGQQQLQQQQQPALRQSLIPQFQRSRSLGGYYNNRNGSQQQQQQQQFEDELEDQPPLPPVRNQQQQFFRGRRQQMQQQQQHPGSLTPMSYARWQHAHMQDRSDARHRNQLYGTPPTARHTNNAILQQQQQQQLVRRPQLVHQQASEPIWQQQQQQQMLPPSRYPQQQPGYHTDPSEFESDEEFDDMITSQATQGYSEGLADNELESEAASDVVELDHHLQARGRSRVRANPPNKMAPPNPAMSPLEYSAMLKLYNNSGAQNDDEEDVDSSPPPKPAPRTTSKGLNPNKDVTPDSGVAVESGEVSKKSTDGVKQPKSHLSSSSSLNDLLGNEKKRISSSGGGQRSKIPKRVKDYTRVNTGDHDDGDQANNTVFSSSSAQSSSSSNNSSLERNKSRRDGNSENKKKSYHPLVSPPEAADKNLPAFRWDGSQVSGNPLEDKNQEPEEVDDEDESQDVVRACQEIQQEFHN